MTKFYYGEMTLEVPESVYYPREDSELLAGVVEKTDLSSKKVLEIGCGCGFLSIIAAKAGATVTAIDINEEAVKATRTNATASEVKIEAIKSDLFSAVTGTFDLIIFNAPYLPAEEQDLTYSGGLSGRETIERVITKTKDYLKPSGNVLLLISSLTGEREVAELFEKAGLKATVAARKKIPWEELIVVEASQ